MRTYVLNDSKICSNVTSWLDSSVNELQLWLNQSETAEFDL